MLYFTELGEAVMTVICIQEMPGSLLSHDNANHYNKLITMHFIEK
jgi:hypothetical protein